MPGPQNVLKCMSAIPIRQSLRTGFLNTTAPGATLDCQGSLNAEESLIPHPHPRGQGQGLGGRSYPTGSLEGLLSKRCTHNLAFLSVISPDLSK